MFRRIGPILCAVLGIAALFASQTTLLTNVPAHTVLANNEQVETASERDASVSETVEDGPESVDESTAPTVTAAIPPERTDCAVEINGYALTDPLPPGYPDYGQAPPFYGVASQGIVECYETDGSPTPGCQVTRQPGDTVHWFFTATNISNTCPDGTGTMTDVKFVLSVGGNEITIPANYETTDEQLALGELGWAQVDITVPVNSGNTLDVLTWIGSEIDNPAYQNDDPDPPPPNDVSDFDVDVLQIEGPGAQVVSFTADPPTASPGEFPIDFTLTIQNTRPAGTPPIQGIQIDSTDPTNGANFAAKCSEYPTFGGDWTTTTLPHTPITELGPGESAQCTYQGEIPAGIVASSYSLSADVTVTDGNPLLDLVIPNVTSDAVQIAQPDVGISKRVVQIQRGAAVIYSGSGPVPPAAAGDLITYEIVVENTGDLDLENIWVVDSLTGVVPVSPALVMAPTDTLPLQTSYTVSSLSQDPLNNNVTVTADTVDLPVRSVDAQASAVVDIIDSALEMDFEVFEAGTNNPVFSVTPPANVEYQLTLRNTGGTEITNLEYVPLSLPLQTVGTKPPISPTTLAAGGTLTLPRWPYAVSPGETDPLVSTIRVRGIVEGTQVLYAQEQVSLDISTPGINIAVQVLDPITDAVLRGSNVIYEVTVTNTDGVSSLCNVIVKQYLRDPDTGTETPINLNLPMTFPVTPGQLAPGEQATGTTSYLVTAADKDPLDMIFEVTSDNNCVNPVNPPLTDRTTVVLDISDAQVNAEIIPDLGPDGVAVVGDTNIEFTYVAQNVSGVTLENLTATWCVLHRFGEGFCPKQFDPGQGLNPTEIGSFESTSGKFTYAEVLPSDADANPFVVEVTLVGTDNKGNEVSIKTAKAIPVATPEIQLDLTGPSDAVIGDTVEFGYTITNTSGTALTDIDLLNLLEPLPGGGFNVVAHYASILGDAGQNVVSGVFDYTIDPSQGIQGDTLTLSARVEGDSLAGPVLAVDSVEVDLIPILEVVKTGDTSAVPGEAVNYAVLILNNSEDQDVSISGYADAVLEGYGLGPFDNGDFSGWVGTPGVLGPGESVSGSFQIPSVDPDPNPLVNVFSATGNREYDNAQVYGEDDHELGLACPVDFRFQVQNLDDQPDNILGETLHWQMTVMNRSQGAIDISGITESLFWEGLIPPNAIVWPHVGQPGHLEPGETAAILFEEPPGSPLQNFADIRLDSNSLSNNPSGLSATLHAEFGETGGVTECTETHTHPVFSPILVFKLPDKFFAFTGEDINYTITLENLAEVGDAPYDNYLVTAYDNLLLPNPLEFEYAPGVFTDSGILGPGDSVETTSSYTVPANPPQTVVNTVIAEFPDPDPTTPDMLWYTSYSAEVGAGNPLNITKQPNTTLAVPGTEITYDYTITNTSDYVITNIRATDNRIGDLIPGMTQGVITLDPGESFTGLVGVPYLIPIDALNPLTNTVTVTGIILGREIEQELTVSVALQESEIQITKYLRLSNQFGQPGTEVPGSRDPDGLPQVDSGTGVHYCFEIINNGAVPIDDIVVNDILYAGTEVQDAFEQAVIDTWDHDANPDMLDGGESVDFCLPRFILTLASGQDPFNNLVTLDGNSPTIPVHAEDSLSVDIIGTDLIVTKLPSPPLAFVGDTVTYEITIKSNFDENILLDEILDTRENGSPVPIPASAFTGWSLTPGTLAPDEEVTYTYDYVIQASDPNPLVNVATASGLSQISGTELFDSSRAVVAVTQSRLLVEKRATPDVSAPSPDGCEVKDGIGDDPGLPACQMISYRVTITNVANTPDTVYDITAFDLHFDAVTGAPVVTTFSGSDLTDDSLDPYETAVIVYELPAPTESQLAADPNLDPFLNTITVYGTVDDVHGNPLPGAEQVDSTESVDILQPNVRITKVPEFGAAAPGQDVPYTVTITNIGGAGETLTDLVLTDLYYDLGTSLPVNLLQIDLDSVCPDIDPAICPFTYGPEPYIDRDGDPLTLEPNPLDGTPYDPAHHLQAGERLTGTITAPVPSPWPASEFTDVVQIDANAQPTPTPVMDRASATIDIRAGGINVEKFATVSSASVGSPVQYTIRVTNVGTMDINQLILADAGIDQADDLLDGVEDGAIEFPNSTYPAPFDDSGDPAVLEPDEEFEFQYTHTLTAQDADPYVNEVSVIGFTESGSVVNVDQAVVDVIGAVIGVEKFVCVGDDTLDDDDPTTFLPGCDPVTTPVPVVNLTDPAPHTITYYLHITNPGALPLYDIVVSDTVGTVGPITWPYSDSNGDGLDANDLAPGGGDDEIWVMYTYDVQPTDPDPLTNLVTVTGTPEAGNPVQDTDSVSVMLVTGDLQLSKSVDLPQAQIGDTVTYTLTVENLNTSAEDILNVNVVDPLSGSATAICTYATLQPGPANAQTCTFDHTITAADAAPLVNTAVATGQLGGVTISDTASATVEIVSSGLLVTKTANPTIANIGDTVTFTYQIENTGTVTINNLVVSDSDPALTFPAPPDPNSWPQFLNPGQVEVRTLTRVMQATDPDPYTNTVTVSGELSGGQQLVVQATETVFIASGDLVVSNTPSVTFATPGQDVTFTYVVTNLGTDDLTNVTVTDNQPGCPDNSLPTLGAGLSQTFYCTVTAALPGPIVSTVYAEGTAPGPVTLFDTATASVDVTAGNLLVTKSADLPVASPGDTITFTVEITNVGAFALYNFDVVDTMYTLTPPVPGDTLAPGASHIMTGTFIVPTVSPPSSLSNTVTVTADDGDPDPTTYEDSDTETVAILDPSGAGDLVVTKSVLPTQALPGDTVTYSFRVQNIGTTVATGVQLNDAMFQYATPAIPTQPWYDLPDLAPGNVWIGTFDIVIPADWTDTTFVNTVQVLTDPSATLQDTASATVDIELLTLEKSADVATVPAGVDRLVTYTFTITNNSTADVPNVTLDDPVITTWNAPGPLTDGIVPAAGLIITGTATVPNDYGGATFDNTASLQVSGVEVASDSVSIIVGELPTLTKTANVTSALPNGPVSYTFVVENPSLTTSYTVTLDDPIITSWSSGPVVDVAEDSTVTVTGTGTVPANQTDPVFTNTAQLLLGGVPIDTASADVDVELLSLDKTADVPAALPGDTVTYTFTITNNSTVDVPNVTLEDLVITTWNAPGPLTDGIVPPAGLILTGTATIPVDYPDPTFDNTARLLVGGVEVASDMLQLPTGEFTVVIDRVVQIDSGEDLIAPDEPLQTGERVGVIFTVSNAGPNMISGLAYQVLDDRPAPAADQSVGCQTLPAHALPATLQPAGEEGDSAQVQCVFTPPEGKANYTDANGLMRTLIVRVTGTDEGPTADPADDEPVEALDSESIELIDLVLTPLLELTGAVDNGVNGTVYFRLTLTNMGASRLGCTAGEAPGGDEPCHLAVTVGPTPNVINQALQATHGTAIANTVLQPDLNDTLTTDQATFNFSITLVQPLLSAEYTVTATGGYFDVALDALDLLPYYLLHPTTSPFATPGMEVYVVPDPNPPVYGENVTYTFQVINHSLFAVSALSGQYSIVPLATAPQLNNGIVLTSGGASPAQQSGPFTLTFSPTTLAPGEVATATASKVEDNTSTYQVNVTATGYTFANPLADPTPLPDTTASNSVTITPVGAGTGTEDEDLDPNATAPEVTKEANVSEAQPGDSIVWTVTVRNGSTHTMPDMVLQDQLPTGLVLDSSTADVGVVVTAQTTVTVSIGTMEPGDTATITIYSTVADTAASPSVMTNSACATTSDGEQDCAEATVNIGPDVTGLPDTGIGGGTSSGGMGFPSILGIVLAGALMLLMAAGTSDRRVIIAMLFVVVVIAVVVVGVAMVLMGGEENGEPTDEAESPVETPAPLEETPEGGPIPEVEIEFPPTPTPYVVSPPAAMPYLLIPKLGDQFEVPVPIVEMPIVNRRWDVSGLGYYVGWLEGTTWMDPTWGNTVLAAHVQLGFNNPGPFWGLGELAPGDEIIVVEGDVEHRFEVVETAAVDPDDWSAAAPTDDPMLTLITCTNWDQNYGVFADRMVVRAVPAGMADPASEPMNSAG